jgi:peptide/nickel transport system substrate-binding protein
MRVKKRWLALSGVVGLILALQAILLVSPVLAADEPKPKQDWEMWGDKFWPPRPVQGGIFRTAARLYIGQMNPNHFPVLDFITLSRMYEKLINHDGTYKPTVPWLAESWEFLDTVTVLMKLRQGVKFHDGSAFNAHSLKYQMEWIRDKKNGAWTRSWLEPLESIEIMDEYTVKWHFKRPWGSFLGTMASVPGYMISAKALEADKALEEGRWLARRVGSLKRKAAKAEKEAEKAAATGGEEAKKAQAEVEKARKEVAEIEARIKEIEALTQGAKPLDTYPVGTGQFMFEKASPGNYIKLKRNPNWWYGKSIGKPEMPYFDGIKVSVIPDPGVRLASLKAGELDQIMINPFQYRLVRDDPRFDVLVMPANFVVFLMFNHAEGPCQDIRMRKAISHAIDRDALVMATQFGMARPASCIYPDDHWTHNPDLKPVSYDPELSKKLLAEAGYANGLTIRGFTGNFPEALAFSKAVMGMLEKVGITWKVEFLGIAAMTDPLRRLDFDMNGMLHPWIFEPDLIATNLYHPDGLLNYGRSRNEKALDLIKAGREEIHDAERVKIYRQLEEVLYKNYEDVWLFWPMVAITFSMNLRMHDMNVKAFKEGGEGYFNSHPRWFRDGRP